VVYLADGVGMPHFGTIAQNNYSISRLIAEGGTSCAGSSLRKRYGKRSIENSVDGSPRTIDDLDSLQNFVLPAGCQLFVVV